MISGMDWMFHSNSITISITFAMELENFKNLCRTEIYVSDLLLWILIDPMRWHAISITITKWTERKP